MNWSFSALACAAGLLPASLQAQPKTPQVSPAVRTALDQAMKLQDPAQRVESLKKAIDAAKVARDLEGQAESEFDLGLDIRSDEAIAWFRAAANDYKTAGDQETESESLRRLGMSYSNVGENAKALDSYHQAIVVAQAAHSKKMEGRTLLNIGNTYVLTGQRKLALDDYASCLRLTREDGDKLTEGKALLNTGSVYEDAGDMKTALGYYVQSLRAKRESGAGAGGASWALRAIGRATALLGDDGKGLTYLNQALALDTKYGDMPGEAMSHVELGNVHRRLGECANSLNDFTQAHDLAVRIGDRRTEEFALDGMGSATLELGKKQEALAFYQQAVNLAKQIGDRRSESDALSNLASTYDALGQLDQALETFQRVLEMHVEVGDREGQAIALNNLGETYNAMHKWRDAISYFNRAIPIAKEVGQTDLTAHALSELSTALAGENHPELAIVVAKQCVNTYQGMRKHMLELPKSDQHSFAKAVEPAYRSLASLLIKQGRLREAETVMNLLKDEENFDYISRGAAGSGAEGRMETVGVEEGWWAKYQQLQDQALKIDTEEFDLTQKSSTLRSASALTAEQRTDLAQIDARLKVLDAQKDVIDKAADAYFEDVGKQASAMAASVRNEAEERVRQTGDELPSLLERLHRESGEKIGAVYALATDRELEFLIVTFAGRAHLSVPVKSDDLNLMISDFRKQLMNPYADPKPQGEKLYHLVFERLLRQLASAGCTRVVWCLDGTLRYIPLGALWDGKQYLIERVDYTMFDPLNLDRISSDPSKNLEAAGFAATEGRGEAFAPLPGADKELKGVVKDLSKPGFTGAVPGRAFENKGFDESSLTSAMKAEQFSLLHIATHFNVGKDFDSSDLLMGDGNLLSLRKFTEAGAHGRLGHLDLVCLSACDTAESFSDAAGAGSQFSSFVSLTLKDGASAVVASLWPVSDESTPVLMQRFYASWMADKGKGKAEALRSAQLSLLHGDSRFSHPYYWAPFILFGNWK